MDRMDMIISQIHTLSTRNDGDLKKLKDYLRHEQETLKAQAPQIETALQALDLAQNTLGIAFLLAARLSVGPAQDQTQLFGYIARFLKACDEQQAKKAWAPMNVVCKGFAQMAIDKGQQAMMRSLVPLRSALERLRPTPETLTPVHTEFLRVCLKAKAYHMGEDLLSQPIFDIALSNSNCTHMTPQSFLCYFYYGALIRIGMKSYQQALQLLLVVLTCPATCLSAIQADAFKKYVLVSLKLHGELANLPVYASSIMQRFAKSPSYVLEAAEAFKQGDAAALKKVLDDHSGVIQADNNLGLLKQVQEALQRHKVQLLTKTYLTLSLAEIAKEVGLGESRTGEEKAEALLFDMVSAGEINARIDLSSGNVSFEDDKDDMDAGMVNKMQDKLQQILELTQRIATFEQEVVSSETYIRKTSVPEDRAGAAPSLGFDFMDM